MITVACLTSRAFSFAVVVPRAGSAVNPVAAPEMYSCRGTTISNGAHLMTCTETAIGHANPGLSSNPCFRFQSLPLIQHAFFAGFADNLRNWRSIRVDS